MMIWITSPSSLRPPGHITLPPASRRHVRSPSSLLFAAQLGPIVEFTSYYDRYKPLTVVARDAWKEKPGEYNDSIYNLGSHLIDEALTLFGKPDKVSCRSWGMRGVKGLDDSASDPLISLLPRLHSAIVCPRSVLSASRRRGRPTSRHHPRSHPLRRRPPTTILRQGHARYLHKIRARSARSLPQSRGEARGEGFGVEEEAMWGHVQMAKEAGGEALRPKEGYVVVHQAQEVDAKVPICVGTQR